nr:hypothetical protein [uncultured Arsenicibacter sp.]
MNQSQNANSPVMLWAIVELMGHQQISGQVSEYQLGGNFLRIDVPETSRQGPFTRLVNPSTAVYAINPVTEQVARMKAEQLQAKPIDSWDIQLMQQKLLAQTVSRKDDANDDSANPPYFD